MLTKSFFLASLLLALPALARDPFWPLGFNPAPPPPPMPPANAVPPPGAPAQVHFGPQGIQKGPLPPPPDKREPEEEDASAKLKPGQPGFFESLFASHDSTTNQWGTARRKLSVDGFMSSYSATGAQQHSIVMINRNSYRDGDTITVTNNTVCFTWKVVLPDQKHFRLEQIDAVEIKADSQKEKK